jgi:hypothetical protein
MSPYPELAVASQENTVTTSITGIKVRKTTRGTYHLTPVMNIQYGDSINNYLFRWEKLVNGTWYTIITFAMQKVYLPGLDGSNITTEQKDYSSIEVTDANKYSYRCTFAKSFEVEPTAVDKWDISKDYSKGDYVSVGANVYQCLVTHRAQSIYYPANEFFTEAYRRYINEEGITVIENRPTEIWTEIHDVEVLPYLESVFNKETKEYEYVRSQIVDYKINKVDGEYFGSATSVLFNDNLQINDKFLLIHSCTKVTADGQKLLFYSDRYNSGYWFKTVINNPSYITDRGSLSFKTNKNESVIKVIPFQGNILVFANADNVGGSIHSVHGNGDDYDDQSGYYSPYQRKTINSSISCTNSDSIQVCDNLLVFKYFNRVYCINASELNNDVITVTPCNDRILNNEGSVKIPWDDDDCISEVTDSYYSLLWKEKYGIDSDGELYIIRPGIRVKMYYKMSVQYEDRNYGAPWLRDESKIFNTKHILYIKGKPVYLYHNTLVSLSEECYQDLGENYECSIRFKAIDLNYESFFKLIESCYVGFHRKQCNKIDIDVIIRNEAGNVILNSRSKRHSPNLSGIFKANSKLNSETKLKIGSTIQDQKLFNVINKFPCMFVDTTVKAITDGSFSLSRIVYQYTSIDVPDNDPALIYSNIIRPEED